LVWGVKRNAKDGAHVQLGITKALQRWRRRKRLAASNYHCQQAQIPPPRVKKVFHFSARELHFLAAQKRKIFLLTRLGKRQGFPITSGNSNKQMPAQAAINMSLKTRRAFLQALAGCAAAGAVAGDTWLSQTLPAKAIMRTILSEGFGRVVILSFERGEKLREGIRTRLKELDIKNAVLVSAIGTLEKARFHRIKHTHQRPEDEIFEVNAPIELAAVDGVVADGEPHFHMVFQDLDRAYAAHLEDGSVVCYLAEIVLAELKGVALTRRPNPQGIAILQSKGSASD
jgi:predicted DNA-binding protein with PD1-like motif